MTFRDWNSFLGDITFNLPRPASTDTVNFDLIPEISSFHDTGVHSGLQILYFFRGKSSCIDFIIYKKIKNRAIYILSSGSNQFLCDFYLSNFIHVDWALIIPNISFLRHLWFKRSIWIPKKLWIQNILSQHTNKTNLLPTWSMRIIRWNICN